MADFVGLPPLTGEPRQRMYVYLASGGWDAKLQELLGNDWQGYINAYALSAPMRAAVQTPYNYDVALIRKKGNYQLWAALGAGYADPMSAQNTSIIDALTAAKVLRY